MTIDEENTLKTLIRLVKTHKLDSLEFKSIKITKSIHNEPKRSRRSKKSDAPKEEYTNPLFTSEDEEELYTYSA